MLALDDAQTQLGAFPTREGGDPLVHVLGVEQSLRQHRAGVGLGHGREAEPQLPQDRFVGVEVEVLLIVVGHRQVDPVFDGRVDHPLRLGPLGTGARVCGRQAVVAVGRVVDKTQQGLNEGTFAHSVGTDDGDSLPSVDPEGQALDEPLVPCHEGQVFDHQHLLVALLVDGESEARGAVVGHRLVHQIHVGQSVQAAFGALGGGGAHDVALGVLLHGGHLPLLLVVGFDGGLESLLFEGFGLGVVARVAGDVHVHVPNGGDRLIEEVAVVGDDQ